MNILFATCEYAPISQVAPGSLYRVDEDRRGLVRELTRMGHHVVVMVFITAEELSDLTDRRNPNYEKVRIKPLICSDFADTYSLYSYETIQNEPHIFLCELIRPDNPDQQLARAILTICERIDFNPHLFHFNDSLFAAVMKQLTSSREFEKYHDVAKVLSVSQQKDILHETELIKYQAGSFHLSNLTAADLVITSSASLAKQLKNKAWGAELSIHYMKAKEYLVGITGAIDEARWDPGNDEMIPCTFTHSTLRRRVENKVRLQEIVHFPADQSVPIVGAAVTGSSETEITNLLETLPVVIRTSKVQFIIMGEIESDFEALLVELTNQYPDSIVYRRGHDRPLDHLLFAGSDFQLVPAHSDPHGYRILTAMRYGSVPIVQSVAAGADLIEEFLPGAETGSGFTHLSCTSMALQKALDRALHVYSKTPVFRGLRMLNMNRDFSWRVSARRYENAYETAILNRQNSTS
jgi:glycogen synthase